ncbi:MAG: 2-oxoglutarate dehydrogenase E1 component [Betaproteobacteria bacterium]|nr:2-oxoglutarate dehydrogenase E1 component [Betaproteobacteria bacterium]
MMRQMFENSYLYGSNASFIEDLYELYLSDPSKVTPEWRGYFDELVKLPGAAARDVAHGPVLQYFAELARRGGNGHVAEAVVAAVEKKQVLVLQFINAYRFLGTRHADLDPLKRWEKPHVAELDPAHYGFTDADMDTVFNCGSLVGPEQAPLREIIQAVRDTYCGTVGIEYMNITDTGQKRWIQSRLEGIRGKPNYSQDRKRHILERVTAAEGLEKYLHTRYVGQKRFSGEGGESLIPLLDVLLQRSGAQGVKETVIGMAHRSRLNVLVNTLGKMPKDLFSEFEGKHDENLISGDVKYHQGFSSDVSTPGGPMHLTLAFNPSHLEIVNPVVEGSVRSRQHRRGDKKGEEVLPVLIHGDAAFAGQGVVMETLNLSQTRGYGTGGTVHIVINNQIGFTTSDPRDTRGTIYCTDVAKMVEAPIFHVNGDDPEAVVLVTEIALDFRMQYKKDVVIDMVCFRKLGHNEQDEPMVTQPLMYKIINKHPGTRRLYAERLEKEGVITPGEGEEMAKLYRAALDAGQHTNKTILSNYTMPLAIDWKPYLNRKWTEPVETAVPMKKLKELAAKLTEVPDNFKLHPRVEKIIADRKAMGDGRLALDWGMAENLAYAALLHDGYGVRLSGQDAGRGTFFHRHAVLHDQNRERWDAGARIPLQHIKEEQPDFVVIDSVLSEEAVLGFEYGYATAQPNELVVWEAQCGDFANGAQGVIDQFISSGEAKWGRVCGLVMMLPHGYEGQGPEHSSARLERYLQMCADYNMQVVVPSTPAQMFHLLRRQMIRFYRKPLIIMSPKSMLRHKESVSSLDDLAKGRFQTVIDEVEDLDPKKVRRIICCSGKVYYDLLAERRARKTRDMAIVRIEQPYPFPHEDFKAILAQYPKAKEVLWAQEEPGNQGAWHRIQHYLMRHMRPDQEIGYALRPSSASPAVGYLSDHAKQQKELVEAAFRENLGDVPTRQKEKF